jgi:hypothetical protein
MALDLIEIVESARLAPCLWDLGTLGWPPTVEALLEGALIALLASLAIKAVQPSLMRSWDWGKPEAPVSR